MKIELIKSLQEKGLGEKQGFGHYRFYYPSIKEIIDTLSEKRISFSINEDISTYYETKIKKDEIVVIESDGVQAVMSEFGPIEFGVNVYSLSSGVRSRSFPQSELFLRIKELFDSIDNIDYLKQKAIEWETNEQNTFYNSSKEYIGFNPFYNASFDMDSSMNSFLSTDEKKYKSFAQLFVKKLFKLHQLRDNQTIKKKARKIKNKSVRFTFENKKAIHKDESEIIRISAYNNKGNI